MMLGFLSSSRLRYRRSLMIHLFRVLHLHFGRKTFVEQRALAREKLTCALNRFNTERRLSGGRVGR